MRQYPDYTTHIKGVILSANDVVATVLLLYVDEKFSPENIVSVDLPPKGRDYRAKSKDGKSRFQRGDLIELDCKITEKERAYFTEEDIKEFFTLKTAFDDDEEAKVTEMIFEEQLRFAEEWAELEKRDFAKKNRTSDYVDACLKELKSLEQRVKEEKATP